MAHVFSSVLPVGSHHPLLVGQSVSYRMNSQSLELRSALINIAPVDRDATRERRREYHRFAIDIRVIPTGNAACDKLRLRPGFAVPVVVCSASQGSTAWPACEIAGA